MYRANYIVDSVRAIKASDRVEHEVTDGGCGRRAHACTFRTQILNSTKFDILRDCGLFLNEGEMN